MCYRACSAKDKKRAVLKHDRPLPTTIQMIVVVRTPTASSSPCDCENAIMEGKRQHVTITFWRGDHDRSLVVVDLQKTMWHSTFMI
eukprot:scaffold1068_cov167-Amphora_coffeaeformis.AAC.14